MFPIRDTIRSRTVPFVNISLIIVNLLVFIYQFLLGPQFEEFIFQFGLIPARFFFGLEHNVPAAVFPVFTSMFLHGGWMHVLGNMWFLYIFGDNVEDRVGHASYVLFYLLCGIVAAMAQTVLFPGSKIPMVGASGAIAGVLGGYFVMFPQSRILTLVPIFVFIQLMEIPAVVFLIFWFVFQFVQGSMLSTSAAGGVAWWAHIGGFIAGVLLIFLFRKKQKPHFYYY